MMWEFEVLHHSNANQRAKSRLRREAEHVTLGAAGVLQEST